MIDREEVEALRDVSAHTGEVSLTDEYVAELCRVYLAWLDAPVGEVATFPAGRGAVTVGVRLSALEQCTWDDGKRVRLLPAGGGE